MRALPPLRALQVFDASARHGSFLKAANELGLTPSSVSHQIKTLEDHLQVQLFHREHRAVQLTDWGERYAGQIAQSLAEIEAATHEIGRMTKPDILTIHSVPSIATQWLMPRLARFASEFPEIDVRINASVTRPDLFTGAPDIDIAHGRILERQGLCIEKFPDETIVPLCAPELVAQIPKPWTPALLEQLPILHSEVNLTSWQDWFRHYGLPVPDLKRGLRFDRSFMAISAAVDGLGICLESRLMVERELASGRLIIPFGTENPPVSQAHSFVALRSRLRLNKIRIFRQWLFRELQASSEGPITKFHLR